MSTIEYLPYGRASVRTGTTYCDRWLNSAGVITSFQKSAKPAARAISGACSVTLVEPPIAIATMTALRIEVADHDVARLEALRDHLREVADQLVRELLDAAGIVGRRRHHVQRLHADDADEGLHGVVGEHAAAAAVTGTGMAGDVVAVCGVRMAGDLIGADDVELLAGLRIGAGMDRAIRHDDRGLIVLEQCGQRADRRLVAGDDGDGAGKPGGAQMFAERIVRHFTPDQRVAHFARAVADAVRGGDGVFRLDQAQLHLAGALADAALEAGVDRIDLRHHAHVALAVALGADHADRRLVDQVRIGAKFARNPDGLGRAAWMVVDAYNA